MLIVHIENPTESTKKPIRTQTNLAMFQDTKSTCKKCSCHFCTVTVSNLKKKLRKQLHLQ